MTGFLKRIILPVAVVGFLTAGVFAKEYKLTVSESDPGKWVFQPGATVPVRDGQKIIRAQSDAGGRVFAVLQIPPGRLRGDVIRFRCEVKAENVSEPPNSWNGVKFMLVYKDKYGIVRYPQAVFRHGGNLNFDFTKVEFVVQVPKDVSLTLNCGIELSTGAVEFRNISIEEIPFKKYWAELFPPPVKLPEDFKCEYSEAVKNMPVCRGFMSSTQYRKGDIDEMAKWGANLVRWQIQRSFAKVDAEMDIDDFNRYIDSKLDEMEQIFADCRRLGIKVILDVHAPPGGLIDGKNMRMFFESKYRDAFIDTWRRIVQRTQKDKDVLYGYDIINEPRQQRKTPDDYLKVQYEVAKAIREIDPETPILIESNNSASPGDFAYLAPLPLKNIIYQAHMYSPLQFTHQGIGGQKVGAVYPSLTGGEKIDKESLRENLNEVRRFQQKYGARILIGEFNAIVGADGEHEWLYDVIDIMEGYKWDWCYHAFREWGAWSPEHIGGWNNGKHWLKRPAEGTLRKELLTAFFKRNHEEPGSVKAVPRDKFVKPKPKVIINTRDIRFPGWKHDFKTSISDNLVRAENNANAKVIGFYSRQFQVTANGKYRVVFEARGTAGLQVAFTGTDRIDLKNAAGVVRIPLNGQKWSDIQMPLPVSKSCNGALSIFAWDQPGRWFEIRNFRVESL
ncbi:MAG: cellulase family glycosylhydrolase [Victivallaceae bacterium]|nr:cellulase family glycosylhydrolase [Victivallaceae bacterium]